MGGRGALQFSRGDVGKFWEHESFLLQLFLRPQYQLHEDAQSRSGLLVLAGQEGRVQFADQLESLRALQ